MILFLKALLCVLHYFRGAALLVILLPKVMGTHFHSLQVSGGLGQKAVQRLNSRCFE